ncbi:MAG: hypothetical protein MRERC_5c092 [Mycoplasmataceae bacterium RC_NB112A]|nr:MAG: hypothetical protein MRERC_5c092 [Mycoplasmataceae bacterium RC_NB112A]
MSDLFSNVSKFTQFLAFAGLVMSIAGIILFFVIDKSKG